MANRTRDVISLREAARRCRAIGQSGPSITGYDYLKLADEIDQMILVIASPSGDWRQQPRAH
jgi:hypothetical protein